MKSGISPDIGLVKIDVEGAELEVLISMKHMLKDCKPWILAEILPPYSADNEERISRNNHIEKILLECGYAIYRVEKTIESHCSGLCRLNGFGIYDRVELSDYIFVPAADCPHIEDVFQIF